MGAFIYINGYPGVGKLTIAKELSYVSLHISYVNQLLAYPLCNRKVIANSKIFHNHLLIDPVAALFKRDMDEYQPLRKALVRGFLERIFKVIVTS